MVDISDIRSQTAQYAHTFADNSGEFTVHSSRPGVKWFHDEREDDKNRLLQKLREQGNDYRPQDDHLLLREHIAPWYAHILAVALDRPADEPGHVFITCHVNNRNAQIGELVEQALIETLKEHGIKVIPIVDNDDRKRGRVRIDLGYSLEEATPSLFAMPLSVTRSLLKK